MGATMCNHLSNFRHPALNNVDKLNGKGKGSLTKAIVGVHASLIHDSIISDCMRAERACVRR